MLKTNFTIGVKSYALTLAKTCVYDHACKPELRVSFNVQGDFLNAALSDDINHTVDYEQLCKFICYRLTNPEDLNITNLKLIMREFSDLINVGLITLEVSCPHTYSKDEGLL